jgi:predicted secreted hydrolase
MILNTSCGNKENTGQFNASLSISSALKSGVEEGFVQAVKPRKFSFPADHGPHDEYKNEWWYYTGNLDTKDGRHFGYELTFFRTGLKPFPQKRKSSWKTNNIYMAHFAVTDVENKQFYAFDRFSRDGLELAGATSEPYRVWLEDWSASGKGKSSLPMNLRAAEGNVSIDLTLVSDKPPVLEGNNGLSQKGSTKGNASYYYSFTRMATEGTISISGKSFNVKGMSWMDREWSTSSLEKDQIGWDWFAIQLSDGREIMYYQMRKKNGTPDPLSNGTIVDIKGKGRFLPCKEVKLIVTDTWETPDKKAIYPSGWKLSIPSEKIELEIIPYIKNQELNVTVRYWEGAIYIKGTCNGTKVTGSGYVELTGYTDMPR